MGVCINTLLIASIIQMKFKTHQLRMKVVGRFWRLECTCHLEDEKSGLE